jgi:hypothetical protein
MTYSAVAAAERKRRSRAKAAGPVFYSQPDWRLFLDPATLPQKAGCELHQIGRVVLKELVDNALDSGAREVTVTGDAGSCTVIDDGPGVDDVELLFAVNRPLISSKLKRLPTRGMLGNGTITITTRGRRLALRTDKATGKTVVTRDMPTTHDRGVQVELAFPEPLLANDDAYETAREAIRIAGEAYPGPSHPRWYGPPALRNTFAAAPADATVGQLLADLFEIDIDDDRAAGPLSETDVEDLLARLPDVREFEIGEIGEYAFDGAYFRVR